MNLLSALLALLIVVVGGYYIFHISPADRDSMVRQYTPDVQKYTPTESQAKDYLQKGVDQVNQLLQK